MGWGFAGVLLVILVILISGCTQTGELSGQELTQEEELVLEEFLNQTQEPGPEPQENTSPPAVYQGHTGPQNITQPLGCPGTCDDSDNCTYDYCSRDTDYRCVHADRICPNFVRTCPDGVEVVCENTCLEDQCTKCEPDCAEHQLPACQLDQDDCGPCQVPDTENCGCAQITSCVNNDSCCPGECTYLNDSDCPAPDECSQDTDCNDSNACTLDLCEGTPKACLNQEITACIPDGCCPLGCDYANDTDCQEPEQEWGNYSDVIINEIMYDPSTEQCTDYDCEWVELRNKGDYKVNLSGWTLDGNIFDAEIIQAGEYVVVARQLIDSDNDIESFEYFWGNNSGIWGDSEAENYNAYDGNIVLTNSGDTIVLQSPGSYYDSITYTNEWGADGNNRTLERNENSTWEESLTDNGTPGLENSV